MRASPLAVRLGAVSALSAVAFYLVSLPVAHFGDVPASSDSAAQVAAFFAAHRSGVLAAFLMNAVGWGILIPTFLAALRALLPGGDDDTNFASLLMWGAGLLVVALVLVDILLLGVLAFRAPGQSPHDAQQLYDAFAICGNLSAAPTVALLLAFALLARRTGLPGWIAWIAVISAIAHALALFSVARSGVFRPTDIFSVAAPLTFQVWLVGTAVVLLRGRPVAAAA